MAARSAKGASFALAAILLGSSIGCHSTGKHRLPPAWGDRDCPSCEVDRCDCGRKPTEGDRPELTPPLESAGENAASSRRRQPLFGRGGSPAKAGENFDSVSTERVEEARRSERRTAAGETIVAPDNENARRRAESSPTSRRSERATAVEAALENAEDGAGGAPRREARRTRSVEIPKDKPAERTGRARLSDLGDDSAGSEQDEATSEEPDRESRRKAPPGPPAADSTDAGDETAWWNDSPSRGRRGVDPDRRAAQATHRTAAASAPTVPERTAAPEPVSAPATKREDEVEDYYFQPSQSFAAEQLRQAPASDPEQYPHAPAPRANDAPTRRESTAVDPGSLEPAQYMQSRPATGAGRQRIDGIFELPTIQPGSSSRTTSTPPLRSRW